MSTSVELRRLVWDGAVPLQIVLDKYETRDRSSPEFLLSASRNLYLPVYLPRILAYFKTYLNDPELASSEAWWFEFEAVPLKWNWPIGLSYDLLTGLDPHDREAQALPWKLVLHHKDYPKEYVLALGPRVWEDYWINQAKEACYMRDGNAKAIMNLSKDDTTALFRSVTKHDFNTFWTIYDKLILPTQRSAIKNVPIKLYVPGSNNVHQQLVPPFIGDEPQTVGMALNTHLSGLFPSRRTCVIAQPLLHGILIPMTLPLLELLYDAMYTDGFLHISIVMMA